jgi:predicted nucleotide-binding protein (sugar kinase/HSP70/actin superfamily)
MKIATDLWTGLVAADFLSRYRYELRPYEKHPGDIEKAYPQARETLFRGILNDKIMQSFKKALEILKQVPTEARDLIRIGVVGDAFTRVHEYGMGGIFNTVEKMGGALMIPPSWYDFVCYGAERRVSEFFRQRQFFNALKAKMASRHINSWKRKIQDLAAIYSEMFAEPNNVTLTEFSKPYVNVDVAPVIPSMFVGKTVDFVETKNVHGLINAYGFNCSLGKISTACINRIRQDYGDIPMLTFIDDGLQQTNIQTRLEAFMEQAMFYKSNQHCSKGTSD